MNRAEEDYIKTIYELSNSGLGVVKTVEISEHLGFTDQSVNEMIKKLSRKEFLEFIPYHGVKLTNLGKTEAIRMVRAHRVWELFLTKMLGFKWIDVHDEAENLEHTASTKIIDALYQLLGYPKYCTHGNPIPKANGEIEKPANKRLADYQLGDLFVLKRVLDKKELLVFLDQHKIELYDEFKIIEKDEFNELMILSNNKSEINITTKIAKMIFG